MPAIIHLNNIWGHTLAEILNHDPKSQMGIIVSTWVKHNNMEDPNSLLTYTADKFTPTGSLCQYKEKADSETLMMMPTTPLQGLYECEQVLDPQYTPSNAEKDFS